jgi:hypothetical protein
MMNQGTNNAHPGMHIQIHTFSVCCDVPVVDGSRKGRKQQICKTTTLAQTVGANCRLNNFQVSSRWSGTSQAQNCKSTAGPAQIVSHDLRSMKRAARLDDVIVHRYCAAYYQNMTRKQHTRNVPYTIYRNKFAHFVLTGNHMRLATTMSGKF